MAKDDAKTKPTEVTVDHFIAAIPDPSRRAEAAIIAGILGRVSGEAARMWGPSIIGFGTYHYRYSSGHEGYAPRIAFSPRKAQMVLYLARDVGDRQAEYDALFALLGKHSTGKACLYIKRLSDVDLDVLAQLSALSWAEMARRHPPSA